MEPISAAELYFLIFTFVVVHTVSSNVSICYPLKYFLGLVGLGLVFLDLVRLKLIDLFKLYAVQ